MPEPLLQQYLRHQAETRGDRVAVSLGETNFTYAEIETRSSQLAHLLVDLGCRPGDRVALLLAKTPESIIAMHAVLKAGCAYVPVDHASPAARTSKIVSAADPRLALVNAATAHVSDEALAGVRRLDFGWATDASAGLPLEGPPTVASEDSIAHILFTSGSTGAPKGVPITHRNVVRFIQWAVPHFVIRPDDRLSGHTPHYFDLSTFDIYGSIAAGACLYVVPEQLNVSPRGLAAFIRDSKLTQWFSVPAAMTLVSKFDAAEEGFPALRRVIWCGEALPLSTLRYWRSRAPEATFTNLYGPTEATIASSHYTVPEHLAHDVASLPIGTACAGEELLVLDESLQPVPTGEVADLYIAGDGLSPGYWRDEEASARAFLSDPRPGAAGSRIYRTGDLAHIDSSGQFHFHGRLDSQIKTRGYRVELGEIEVALGTVASLRESAVIGLETNGFEGTMICCGYEADEQYQPADVKAELARLLPSYMLPSRWLRLENLPRNVNGKIDRPALRALFHEEPGV